MASRTKRNMKADKELEQKVKKLEGELDEAAPPWMVTFGDLMSLLLCFFLLLLSFSELDRQKYKEVAGSLREAFGVQKKLVVFNIPRGERIIARNFDQQNINVIIREKIQKELEELIQRRFKQIRKLIQLKVGKNKLTIRLMGETTFDSGKAEIKPEMIPLLEKVGSILKELKGDITIAGHTDNVPIKGGPFKSNLALSMARAASVADFFIHKVKLDPSRISTMGFGEYRPIASNKTPEGREKNRRVEIILSTMPDLIAGKNNNQ